MFTDIVGNGCAERVNAERMVKRDQSRSAGGTDNDAVRRRRLDIITRSSQPYTQHAAAHVVVRQLVGRKRRIASRPERRRRLRRRAVQVEVKQTDLTVRARRADDVRLNCRQRVDVTAMSQRRADQHAFGHRILLDDSAERVADVERTVVRRQAQNRARHA